MPQSWRAGTVSLAALSVLLCLVVAHPVAAQTTAGDADGGSETIVIQRKPDNGGAPSPEPGTAAADSETIVIRRAPPQADSRGDPSARDTQPAEPEAAGAPAQGGDKPFDETASRLDGVLTNEAVVSFGHVESLAGDVLNLSMVGGPVLTIERRQLAVVDFVIGQKSRGSPASDTSAASTDRILTYDGRTIAERVSGISENAVTTERQTIARADVDRIFFSVRQGSSPPPEEPPPPPPPAEGDILGQICPPDKPLGGWLDWQVRENGTGGPTASTPFFERTGCDVTDRHRIRFRLAPHPDMVNSVYTYLLWADSFNPATPESHYEVDAGKCEDYHGDDRTCSGSAKSASGRSGGVHVTFHPFVPSLHVAVTETWFKVPYICNGRDNNRYIPEHNDFDIDPWSSQDRLKTVLVHVPTPYGDCWIDPKPSNAGMAKAACLKDPRRFAGIPFRGTSQSETNRFGDWSRASWAVCCGCGERFPPTPETEPAEDENCFEHMASLLEFWKQELAAREAAFRKVRDELNFNTVSLDSLSSREKSAVVDTFQAIEQALDDYQVEMAIARRECMECAERQGLSPSQCPQYPPYDPRDK